jgi:hypothetical protein
MESPGWSLPYSRRGARAEASAFELAAEQSPEDTERLLLALKAADVAPRTRDKTPLSVAIERRLSARVLKAILESGVPVDQKDRHGRTPLEALLQTNAHFARVPGLVDRYDRADQRRLLALALQLLAKGAAPPPVDYFALGVGNEMCARCVDEYRDSALRVVIERAIALGRLPEWMRSVAAFLSARSTRLVFADP